MDTYATSQTLLQQLCNTLTSAQDGWQIFYDKYKKLVISICYKKGISQENTAEILQEVMLAVFNNGQFAYDPSRGVKFRTWLSRIINNKISDFYRKQYKNKEVPLEPGMQQELPDKDDEFEDEWKSFIMSEALERLKMEVEPETYQVFDLYCRQEMKPKDIEALLGVSVNTVYVAKSRCMDKLKHIKQEIENEYATGQ